MLSKSSSKIEIAKLLKPHGIRGEIKVKLFSDNYDAFCDREFAYIRQDGAYRRITYTAVRVAPPFVYILIEGVNSRNDAETYSGVLLYLDRVDFDEPDDGEYYVCDLVGLRVVDEKGEKLGTLKDVLQHGAADVYVVDGPRGFMFPALRRVIRSVDIANGEICVDSGALGEVAVYDR
jgi:16S rRNA processing protein RimM